MDQDQQDQPAPAQPDDSANAAKQQPAVPEQQNEAAAPDQTDQPEVPVPQAGEEVAPAEVPAEDSSVSDEAPQAASPENGGEEQQPSV